MVATRDLRILYRGPLSSCNYDCGYCPFAKRPSRREELEADERALSRFVSWCRGATAWRLSILFTPWGEGLVRRWYQRALVELGHLPHVAKVAIQTNLSGRLDWLGEASLPHVGLWVTYHPGQVARARFLGRCRELDRRGVRYSVGAVGLPSHAGEIEALRAALAPGVYLWINAHKSRGAVDEGLVERFTLLDPLHPLNAVRHRSLGEPCRAGAEAISVDGEGDVRRCHFVPDVLGNLYRDGLEDLLGERLCPNATCGCHIGYVHLDRLRLYPVYGDGLMERVPAEPLWRRP